MKKVWMFILTVASVLTLAGFTAVGVAMAKDESAGSPGKQVPLQVGVGEGLLHEYMIAALAEAVDLTPQELETRLESGETMVAIALAQGFPADQIPNLLREARNKAIDAALADGVIDQQQADAMKAHGFRRGGAGSVTGFGRGRCGGTGVPVGGRTPRTGR